MKKLWSNIGIFFGCFLLLVTFIGAVLVIAPGMELLGIMFIRSTSGSVKQTEYVADAHHYKTINITSDNIPVVVEFVQSYTLSAILVEDYNGFAKAGGTPTVKVASSADTIVVEASEYKPFLFHSRGEESGLFIKVPMYFNNNIVINSNKSNIKFSGQKASVQDITIITGGAIELGTDMDMNSLALTMGNKSAVVSDEVNMNGTVKVKSKGGDLSLPTGFDGKVEFTSTTGDLLCASCGQLSFNSKSGRVRSLNNILPSITGDCVINTNGAVTIGYVGGSLSVTANHGKVTYGEDGKLYVNRVSILTKTGKVILKGVYTNPENKITTKYGDISVEQARQMTISTQYGDVEVKRLDLGSITTKSGDVDVELIISDGEITTKGGDVEIGMADKFTLGAKITTKGGDVEIVNAGDSSFVITTSSGDVSFTQGEGKVAKLEINSEKGDVNLNEISGETTVNTTGKIIASVKNITKPITLNGKNKEVTVSVKQHCYCDLSSNKKIVSAPGMEGEHKTFNSVPEGVNQYIKITTKKGKIAVNLT